MEEYLLQTTARKLPKSFSNFMTNKLKTKHHKTCHCYAPQDMQVLGSPTIGWWSQLQLVCRAWK